MEELNYTQIINKLNNFLENKNIQLDNLIIVCLLILLFLENDFDLILFIILFLLIF